MFRYNAHVGVNVRIKDLLREYHAVVLAGGSTVPRDLPLPGRQLKGVYYAMQFLKQQNKRNAGLTPTVSAGGDGIESNIYPQELLAKGKNVVVIGGGDTGSDCVGTSNRQGALSVTQFELLPKPPDARTTAMPWPTYPMTLKTSTSHEEGVKRNWAVSTKEFIDDGKGNLKALRIVDLEWSFGQDGRPSQFQEVPGSEREIPCEMALLAMGFLHPQADGLVSELGVELDERGNVKATEKNYATSINKVFTAGDMRRGQSLVVWAISEGRECARKVDEFLVGTSVLEQKDHFLLSQR